jgi:hypothetical protein
MVDADPQNLQSAPRAGSIAGKDRTYRRQQLYDLVSEHCARRGQSRNVGSERRESRHGNLRIEQRMMRAQTAGRQDRWCPAGEPEIAVSASDDLSDGQTTDPFVDRTLGSCLALTDKAAKAHTHVDQAPMRGAYLPRYGLLTPYVRRMDSRPGDRVSCLTRPDPCWRLVCP